MKWEGQSGEVNWEAAGGYHSGTLHKKHGVVSERQIGPLKTLRRTLLPYKVVPCMLLHEREGG